MTVLKKAAIIIFTFSLFISAFADTLDYLNASWNTVTGGELVCAPEATDFGFVTVTDGRTLEAFSSKGNLLWSQKLPLSSKCMIKVLEKDFILSVTSSGKKLSMFNSSGVPLWEKNLSYKVIAKPVEGRDGRFFVYGKNTVECYSITGLLKWSLSLKESLSTDLQPCEVQDGSFVFFLDGNTSENTKALRINPFGIVNEEITFAGEITYSTYNEDGVYVCFSDGNAGLFSLEDGKEFCENKFVISENNKKHGRAAIYPSLTNGHEAIMIYENPRGITAAQFDNTTGNVKHTFEIPDIKFEKISNCILFNNNLLITDQTSCLLYNLNGLEIRKDQLPLQNGKTKWNYVWFSNEGYLVVCRKNWAMDGFRIIQTEIIPYKKQNSYSNLLKSDSSKWSSSWIQSFEGDLFTENRQSEIFNGNYGEKEADYTCEIKGFTEAYIQSLLSSNSGARVDKNLFQKDVKNVDAVLAQLPYLVTNESALMTARLLRLDKNQVHLLTLLKGVTNTGWDPDGKILFELQTIVEKSDKKNETLLLALCDSVYSVCAFMGRPAFNKNGKEILSKMLYPQYGKKINDKARECIKKIGELGM